MSDDVTTAKYAASLGDEDLDDEVTVTMRDVVDGLEAAKRGAERLQVLVAERERRAREARDGQA